MEKRINEVRALAVEVGGVGGEVGVNGRAKSQRFLEQFGNDVLSGEKEKRERYFEIVFFELENFDILLGPL